MATIQRLLQNQKWNSGISTWGTVYRISYGENYVFFKVLFA